MKTTVHKNLHAERDGMPSWSITQKGLVVGYAEHVALVDCVAIEDPKKAFGSRNGGKRTVHLWVRGTLASATGLVPFKGRTAVFGCDGYDHPGYMCDIRYNPKRDKGFTRANGNLWTAGKLATFDAKGMKVD